MSPEQAEQVDLVYTTRIRAYERLADALIKEIKNNPTFYLPPHIEALLNAAETE